MFSRAILSGGPAVPSSVLYSFLRFAAGVFERPFVFRLRNSPSRAHVTKYAVSPRPSYRRCYRNVPLHPCTKPADGRVAQGTRVTGSSDRRRAYPVDVAGSGDEKYIKSLLFGRPLRAFDTRETADEGTPRPHALPAAATRYPRIMLYGPNRITRTGQRNTHARARALIAYERNKRTVVNRPCRWR